MGVLVDKTLNMTDPCVLAAQKVNPVLGYIKRSVAGRSREVILSLLSALLNLHLEYSIQLLVPTERNTWRVIVSPKQGHQNHHKSGASLCKKDERVEIKPGEDKALEDFQSIKGAYKTDGERYFSKTYSKYKKKN